MNKNAGQILVQRFFEVSFVGDDRIAEPAQLAKPPFHIQSGSCAEELSLFFYDALNV